MAAEGFDDAVTAVLAARRVLVEADDAGRRQEFVELGFHFFRTAAKELDILAAAGRTDGRNRLFGIAVMATEMSCLAMVDHGHITRVALDDVAALAAHDEGRETAAVEEDDGLLTGCQGFFQESEQGIGDDAVIAPGQLIPHVDDLDSRQRAMADSFF